MRQKDGKESPMAFYQLLVAGLNTAAEAIYH
jgi:hypothetical protein